MFQCHSSMIDKQANSDEISGNPKFGLPQALENGYRDCDKIHDRESRADANHSHVFYSHVLEVNWINFIFLFNQINQCSLIE